MDSSEANAVGSPKAHTVDSPEAHTVDSPEAHTVDSSEAYAVDSPETYGVNSRKTHTVDGSKTNSVGSSDTHTMNGAEAQAMGSSETHAVNTARDAMDGRVAVAVASHGVVAHETGAEAHAMADDSGGGGGGHQGCQDSDTHGGLISGGGWRRQLTDAGTLIWGGFIPCMDWFFTHVYTQREGVVIDVRINSK